MELHSGQAYNVGVKDPGLESIPIVIGREEDGRWWADIESMPGLMACGESRDAAIDAVRALALRVAADCLEHHEALFAATLSDHSRS
jgi:predicted RNase H-like HicB family nuclease